MLDTVGTSTAANWGTVDAYKRAEEGASNAKKAGKETCGAAVGLRMKVRRYWSPWMGMARTARTYREDRIATLHRATAAAIITGRKRRWRSSDDRGEGKNW